MRTWMKAFGLTILGMVIVAVRASAGPGNGAEAFERLKALVGHWETDKTNMNKASLDLELTSGGTAILEKSHMVEDGKPVEMTTLYYLDGGDVKLTHYCMAGNQPRMSAAISPDTKTITFDFIDGTNIPAPQSGHMRRLVIRIPSPGRHIEEWTYVENGKESTVLSDVRRVKL